MAATRGSILLAVLAALWGIFLGVGVFTFGYANGGSYLTNDPAACANCHVMREQYAGWMKASHRSAAVCNDCHAPAGTVAKYGAKALNGFLHSWAFTTGWFPDRIQITGRNFRVTEGACLKCHAEITARFAAHRDRMGCIRCHAGVGHKE
jgi:cytochrome c nitrite reductase small subunit